MNVKKIQEVNYTFSSISVYLLVITNDVAALIMLILTLVPLLLVYIHEISGIPVVLISALLCIIIIVIVVIVTVVVGFVVWKKKSGTQTHQFCLSIDTC